MKHSLARLIWLAILPFTIILACTEKRSRETGVDQLVAINEMVALRTEGLALAEIAQTRIHDDQLLEVISQIRSYYQETHPDFLNVCQGQLVVLQHDDFDIIWDTLQNRLFSNESCVEKVFLALYLANTNRAITLYERLLKESEQDDLHYFALRALPGLYTQQGEIHNLLVQLPSAGVDGTAVLGLAD